MVETKHIFSGDVWVHLEKPEVLGPVPGVPGGWVRYGIRAEGPHRGHEFVLFESRSGSDEKLRGSAELVIKQRSNELGSAYFAMMREPKRKHMPHLLLAEIRLPIDIDSGCSIQEESPYFFWKSVATTADGSRATEAVYLTVTDREHRLVLEVFGPAYAHLRGNSIIEVSDQVRSLSSAQYVVGYTP